MTVIRLSRVVARAIVIGISIGFLYWAVTDWSMADADAYWQAALRLRAGEALYPPVADVESSSVYRYAPWFAWATIPVTFLPLPVAGVMWSVVLVGASAAAVVPLARSGAWLPATLFGAILIGISANGNVHALLIAALVWGVERWSGPGWIAVAASLKAVPILYALVYVGRRQWGRAAVAAAFTVVLVAPFLLYDLRNYVTSPGLAGILINVPVLYAVVVASAILLTVALARGPHGWLVASTTVALALPRFFVYDVTFLIPSVPARTSPPTRKQRAPGTLPSDAADRDARR